MKTVLIKLLHGHTVALKAPEKRLDSLLKDLESAKVNKRLMMFRNAHSGAVETMIDGNAIVAWELSERNLIT
jgi:hypothetical protein